jgi:hypothetical protein
MPAHTSPAKPLDLDERAVEARARRAESGPARPASLLPSRLVGRSGSRRSGTLWASRSVEIHSKVLDRLVRREQRPRPLDERDEPVEAIACRGERVALRRPPANGHRLVVLRPVDVADGLPANRQGGLVRDARHNLRAEPAQRRERPVLEKPRAVQVTRERCERTSRRRAWQARHRGIENRRDCLGQRQGRRRGRARVVGIDGTCWILLASDRSNRPSSGRCLAAQGLDPAGSRPWLTRTCAEDWPAVARRRTRSGVSARSVNARAERKTEMPEPENRGPYDPPTSPP